jgi:hypothetical protein
VTEVPFGEESAGEMVDEAVDMAVDMAVGPGADPGLDQDGWEDPADRPWTPIPRQAHALERSLIPGQRRLKKTSRSA